MHAISVQPTQSILIRRVVRSSGSAGLYLRRLHIIPVLPISSSSTRVGSGAVSTINSPVGLLKFVATSLKKTPLELNFCRRPLPPTSHYCVINLATQPAMSIIRCFMG